MILKSNLIAILTISLCCCSGHKMYRADPIEMKQATALQIFNGQERVLVLSCTRCNCFIKAMEHAYRKDSIFLKSITMLTDTNCTKVAFKMNYIPQSKIDSVSDEMYNVILFKKENGNYVSRVIETEENLKILEIAKSFFEND